MLKFPHCVVGNTDLILPIRRRSVFTSDHHGFASRYLVMSVVSISEMVVTQIVRWIATIQNIVRSCIYCSLIRFSVVSILYHMLSIWRNNLYSRFEGVFLISLQVIFMLESVQGTTRMMFHWSLRSISEKIEKSWKITIWGFSKLGIFWEKCT